jgi:hypothetical protein
MYAQAYASGWGDFTTTDLPDVTGRRPRTLAAFVRDHADAFTAVRAAAPLVPRTTAARCYDA